MDYDVQLFSSPGAFCDSIEAKNSETDFLGVVVGYYWDGDTDHQDDPGYVDIEIGDYRRSWNLDVSDSWVIAQGSINEVGCIHTCQGL